MDPARLLRAAQARGALDLLNRFVLISAGKAAWPMAQAVADLLPGRVHRALVAGPRVSGTLPSGWEALEPAHPFPDNVSIAAGRRALALVRDAAGEAVLVLLSGGSSSMLCAPAEGLSVADKVTATRALMHAGAAIDRLNCVRKHLSALKGGHLGAMAGRSLTLAISDVHHPVEDDPAVIGSGPTVGDPTTFQEALEIVRDVSGIPRAVTRHLARGAAGEIAETIKPGDPRLAAARFVTIGNRRTALAAAARSAEALGYTVAVIEEVTRGEARVAAGEFVSRARRLAEERPRPICVLAGGETTVRVRGTGRGGRNQELALAALAPLSSAWGQTPVARLPTPAWGQTPVGPLHTPVLLASVGTDGLDGPTPAAGAIVDATTLERAEHAGLDWRKALDDNDAYPFFEALQDLIVLGPTGTNVGDLQVLLSG